MSYKHWIPAPEWTGKIAVVVATGPSLSTEQIRIVALARIADACRVIAINDAALNCWFADIVFGGDIKWWQDRKCIPRYAGKKVGIDVDATAGNKSPTQPACVDMLMVRRAAAKGYDQRPGQICTHKNSGAMGVQIADDHKPDKIVLVGFDMREIDGKRHYFGNYDGRLNTQPDIANWIKDFRALQNALAGKLFNATKGSALDFVPYVELATVLRSE